MRLEICISEYINESLPPEPTPKVFFDLHHIWSCLHCLWLAPTTSSFHLTPMPSVYRYSFALYFLFPLYFASFPLIPNFLHFHHLFVFPFTSYSFPHSFLSVFFLHLITHIPFLIVFLYLLIFPFFFFSFQSSQSHFFISFFPFYLVFFFSPFYPLFSYLKLNFTNYTLKTFGIHRPGGLAFALLRRSLLFMETC